MPKYLNLSGDSGVNSYEIADDSITVAFKDGSQYLYDNESAGVNNIETMKSLAQQGDGLNSFINTHVRNQYARKLQ